MIQREATLQEVLDNRETRASRQSDLLSRYGKTLICFTMNIPGPVKNSELIRAGFRLGCRMLEDLLVCAAIGVLHREERCAVTGCESFLVVDGDSERIKALTVGLEDSVPVGRLFDMDVLAPDGQKRTREEMGASPRRCLICQLPSRVCGPVRAHTVAQLQTRTEQLLTEAVFDDRAQTVGALAVKSLLYEVCVTPKPGLVDRTNSGAHQDMDLFTFLSSAPCLQPYFTRCARIGMDTRLAAPEDTFSQIRFCGKLAEQTMLRASGGVNTHKGAIFILGLACAAAGRLVFDGWDHPERLLSQCAEMTRGLIRQDFRDVTEETARTAGERFYARYGVTGIRGQAEAGFPGVLSRGLPVLERGLASGLSYDRACGAALLALLTAADDTNLIARGGRETQLCLQGQIEALLNQTPYPEEETLAELDRQFIRRRLSPGGSADLLALSLFLHFLKTDASQANAPRNEIRG